MQPLISFCLSGRNDSYGGDFLWRLKTSLNLLASNLALLDRPRAAEVVITDWGSKTPIHTVLELGDAARAITRFIVVPPDLAVDLQQDSEFPAALALSVDP